MWFSKKMQGTISVFLVLVLLPMFVLTAVLIDGTIVLGAKNIVNDAGDLAMGGALAHYDEDLLACYGLIAMDETAGVEDKGKSYFESTLSAESITSYFGLPIEGGSFIKLNPENTTVSTVNNTEIWQPYVMENQELEFMKYRAPAIILSSGILDALSQFEGTSSKVKCIKKELEFEEGMSDIQDLLNELYKKMNSSLINKYPADYKDDYMKGLNGDWQKDIEDKAKEWCKYRIVQAAMQKHNISDDVKYEGSEEAAKAAVEFAEDWDCSLESFETYFKIVDATQFVPMGKIISTTPESEMTDEQKEELTQLKKDYDKAVKKAEKYFSDISTKEDNKRNELKDLSYKYYDETTILYAVMDDCEDKCEKILNKLKKSKNDYEEWGDAIDDVKDEETKKGFNDMYEGYWGDLFSEFGEDSNQLVDMKNKIHEDKEYLKKMLLKMEDMKFCGVVYPASRNNWNTIYAYPSTKQINTVSDYKNVHSEMMLTFKKADFSSLNSNKLHDYKEHPFYVAMRDKYCKPKGTENKEAAKEKINNMKAEVEEEDEPESSNERLKQSLEGKNIPTKVSADSSFAPVDTGENENKNKLSNIDDPEKNKKDAKDSGINMLDEKGGMLEDLSKGAGNVVSGLFSKVYESAYEATYVTEMFSNSTTGLNEDDESDTVSLKDMDMTKNYLYQGEAEYILWGDSTPSNDVFYNRATIWTIRFALNAIAGFTNGELRKEALEVATMAGAIFPLSIPLIQNCTILICCALETMIDRSYLIAKGKDMVIMHTPKTWKCYPLSFAKHDVEDRAKKENGVCIGYKEYTWLFLFATMIGDGAGPNARLVRTADCIELNLHEVLEANSILNERTMVKMSSEVGIKTYFLQNAAKYTGSGDISDDNFIIQFNSALGY